MILRRPSPAAVKEFRRYFLISVVALAVDVGILLLAARSVHYLWAATAGFIAGAVASYAMAVRWVFPVRRLSGRPRAEFVVYALVGVAGLGLNNAVIFGAVDALGMALLAGKALAAATTFLFNFVVRKFALFRK